MIAFLLGLLLTAWPASRQAQDRAPADNTRCTLDAFSALASDAGVVRAVDAIAENSFTPPGGTAALPRTPSFCRVQATASSGKDSSINFEVWIPREWNGKLVATGNGGYSNVPTYIDMASALRQGYAAIGGDTGHQTPTPDDLKWGIGQPERILDWGSRSIHTITEAGKRILELAAGRAPRRAYFYGCSTGGHQGYAEIQRYPRDFDGVIAGAPGNNRVRLNTAFLWQFLANHQQGATPTIIPASKLPLITKAVVTACDSADGVVDGVVDDPRACTFDPASLRCARDDSPDCLTSAQIDALNQMYRGAVNPRTGAQIYPGWPKSSEALTVAANGLPASGWHIYWGNTEPARTSFWRYWVFDNPQWDWWSFDFDRQFDQAVAKVGAAIDQVNPDIAAFKAHGGKALVYQGWQDPVVNAVDTIAYYERMRERQGSQEAADQFFRLFLVGGMGHCGGGTGATNFGNQNSPSPIVDASHDLLSALDAWVERGVAPDPIIASRVADGVTVRTRPLCSYPRRAAYTGKGSTDDADNFVCR